MDFFNILSKELENANLIFIEANSELKMFYAGKIAALEFALNLYKISENKF